MRFDELRMLAETANNDFNTMTLMEAAELIALDEAFFGKKPIAKIQSAMDIVYDKIYKNANIDLRNDPAAKELQKAVCEVFGFKSCSIYWSNKPYNTTTLSAPRVNFLHAPFITYGHGQNSSGFYDDKHELKVFIDIDQNLITQGHMTSEELVAVILHEIGHNFDYSLWGIADQWCRIFTIITRTILKPTKKNMRSAATTGAYIIGVELAPGLYQDIRNIDDIIMNAIPPVGVLVRLASKVGVNIYKLLNVFIRPIKGIKEGIKSIKDLPGDIIMLPIEALANTVTGVFSRRKEIYADSFAVSYGYGAELATALEKLNVLYTQPDFAKDSFLAPFYDFAMLQSEMIDVFSGGGSDVQRRIVNMIGKMDQDLEQSGLSKTDINAIKEERARIIEAYEHFLDAEEGARAELTSSFRRMIDNWYGGKNYMFLPTLDRDNLYAK